MDLHVDVNLEKISELNGTKAEALFKYLKNVSKNKTPILIKGVKELDHWNCDIYECQVPASHFSDIKLPAGAESLRSVLTFIQKVFIFHFRSKSFSFLFSFATSKFVFIFNPTSFIGFIPSCLFLFSLNFFSS